MDKTTSMAGVPAATGEATHHWWQQRLTAGANIALLLWLIFSIALLPAYDSETIRAWLASPMAAVPMLLLVISTFYHIRLGLQVVIEDYAHSAGRIVMLALLNYFVIAAATLAIFSILRTAFTPGAA
jgi:succinate dehydrogenase / fumarate reductase membrane anchor subunit